jgi:hypothetical protein
MDEVLEVVSQLPSKRRRNRSASAPADPLVPLATDDRCQLEVRDGLR